MQSTAADDLSTIGRKSNNVSRSGGVYVPPFKIRKMEQNNVSPDSPEYQRMMWDLLKKSINGLCNKVNDVNIKNIVPELFGENIIRGKGLLCRSIMKAQAASPNFTPIFAALIAVINTKIPEIGELLLKRVIINWRRAFRRNDKQMCTTLTKFLSHLTNQKVVDEGLSLEVLTLLLDKPTDDSVEVAVGFLKESGSYLHEISPVGLHVILERLRTILHEGDLDKKTQFIIEDLFLLRKKNFAGFPPISQELDLVEEEDQITHEVSLHDQTLDSEKKLDFFHFDPKYAENEALYQKIRKEILGDDSDAEKEEEDEQEEEEQAQVQQNIHDLGEQSISQLRRTLYLTIMSSLDFEECAHKILKGSHSLEGKEGEVVNMLIECCCNERTYLRFYGLLGQRFCVLKRVYQQEFEEAFKTQYSMIHRLETNKLRNCAKLFAHFLHTDALPWNILQYIHLNEGETTSSSRIFIKILFQELAEFMGLNKLNERLHDPTMQECYEGLFPKDNPKNTRFAINFFTSIGLGGLTDELREWLKNKPKEIMLQHREIETQQAPSSDSDSDSDSDSSSSSSSSS